MPDFTLRQLEYFTAVASEGSLTAAAERCHVTPSALTLAIDELERHLDVQLLVRRKGRGVSLAPAGSRLLASARDVLGRVEALADDAAVITSHVAGRFDLGVFTTLTPFFVPTLLAQFRREYPELEFDLTTAPADELYALLGSGRIDAALLYSVDVPPNLAFDPILRYFPHVLLPADHRLAQRPTVSLGDLADEPLIMLDVPPTRQNTLAIFQSLRLTPATRYISHSFEAVRCMVGAGLGYSILFQRPAATTTYDGHAVRALSITDHVDPAVVGLTRTHPSTPTARYWALRTFLARTRFGGEAMQPS